MKKISFLLLILAVMPILLCSCTEDESRNLVNSRNVPVNEAGKMISRVKAQTGSGFSSSSNYVKPRRTRSGVVLYKDNTNSQNGAFDNIFAD